MSLCRAVVRCGSGGFASCRRGVVIAVARDARGSAVLFSSVPGATSCNPLGVE